MRNQRQVMLNNYLAEWAANKTDLNDAKVKKYTLEILNHLNECATNDEKVEYIWSSLHQHRARVTLARIYLQINKFQEMVSKEIESKQSAEEVCT